jgi:hypothetical protein
MVIKGVRSLFPLQPSGSLPNCLPLPELTRILPINPLQIIWGLPPQLGESRASGSRSHVLCPHEAAPLFTCRLLFLFCSFLIVLVFYFYSGLLGS